MDPTDLVHLIEVNDEVTDPDDESVRPVTGWTWYCPTCKQLGSHKFGPATSIRRAVHDYRLHQHDAHSPQP